MSTGTYLNPEDDDPIFKNMLGEACTKNGIDSVPPVELGLKKNGEPRKRRPPIAKDARAVFYKQEQRSLEKTREKERKKSQKKKTTSPEPRSKSKSKSKGKVKEKDNGKGKKPTKKGKDKAFITNGESLLRPNSSWNDGEDEVGQRLLQDLFVDDPISARL